MYNPYHNKHTQHPDEKLKEIVSTPILRDKIETLLLLESSEVSSLFGLSEEQIILYKKLYFDIDPLLEKGRAFVIAYLEERGDKHLLDAYVKGDTYTKARMGLKSNFSDVEKSSLFDRLVDEALIDSINRKDFKYIDKLAKIVKKNKEEKSVLEKLAELVDI